MLGLPRSEGEEHVHLCSGPHEHRFLMGWWAASEGEVEKLLRSQAGFIYLFI